MPQAPLTHRISSVIDLWLGEQLRHHRRAQGCSLKQVAEACGMSVSLLSQIERGVSTLSLRNLNTLARHLQVPVETLVRNTQAVHGEAAGAVSRANTHRRVDLAEKGIHKECLTPPAGGGIEMYRTTIDPHGSTGDELYSTQKGPQIGYLLEGQLELFLDGQLLEIKCGDSFCYDGDAPRRWRNPGPGPTVVLWAIVMAT